MRFPALENAARQLRKKLNIEHPTSNAEHRMRL
jgi:hypothetical protein